MSLRMTAGSSTRIQPKTVNASIILMGNAMVSNCNWAFTRPSRASEMSTIARMAITGIANRTPVENMAAPAARMRSPMPRDSTNDPAGMISRLLAKIRRTSRSKPAPKNSSPAASCAKITRMPESACVLGSTMEANP